MRRPGAVADPSPPGTSRLHRELGRWRRRAVRSSATPWTGLTGLLALALVALLFVSGAVMTLYYSPTPGVAYDSVDYAQFKLPFGDLVRGVHAYAWNLLLVVVVLHLGRAFLLGAYKIPWERTWVSGVLVALLVPPFLVTGDLLPWNQAGYWSTQVRLGIVSSIPLAGDFLVGLLRGGSHLGIVTLTRFYALHVLFLPCLLLVALAVHFSCIGQALRSGWWDRGDRGARSLLLNLASRWLVVFLVVAVVLGVISWYRPVPLGDPADPTDASYVPRPEWWALALNQLVTVFRGPFTVVATVLIPGGLIGLLVALPFIDGSPERRRTTTLLAAAGIAVVFLGLSAIGYLEHYQDAAVTRGLRIR